MLRICFYIRFTTQSLYSFFFVVNPKKQTCKWMTFKPVWRVCFSGKLKSWSYSNKVVMGFDWNWHAACTALLTSFLCRQVFASHLCLSICSCSALSCCTWSWARAACSCSLLCSTCSCNCMLMLRSCTLCALVFACSVLSCWILDSSLGKTRGKKKCYSLILTVQRSSVPAPTSFCLLRVFSKSCSRTFSTSSSCPLCFCFMLSLILQ